MKHILLRLTPILIGATLSVSNASARTYTSTCAGDMEEGTTWGVDPDGFEIHDDDDFIVEHELYIGTKYMAPDIEVGNLHIKPGAKVLIKFSGDAYSTVRGLNVHGNLVNYGCLGFDRLGSFSNNHDDAVAGGYGRLWLSLWGNLENHGIINTNSLYMRGENQTISSTETIQISEFCPKGAKGNIKALSDITLYNTILSRWAGSVEESDFGALDMDGHTLTLTADAPSEPDIWWYLPGWHGCMTDMKVLFGKGGKLVVNDCYVANNTFTGDNIQVASDSYGFFVEQNRFEGNVDIARGNVYVTCTDWVSGFEVKGNLVNHGNVNSAEIVYPGKGVGGTDYHMLNIGDKGRTQAGDILVNGNFENLGNFGLGYVYDQNNDAHTTLRMITLGGDITIKGEITAKLCLAQVHPQDDYLGTYNTYDGQKLDKKGSIAVKDYLKVNRFQPELETTLVIPADANFVNNAEPQSAPLYVKNGDNKDERGLWNGLVKNHGTMTCLYSERKEWGDMILSQHIDFPEWARWGFDGGFDYWMVSDRVDYLEITERGLPLGDGFVSRSWDITLHGHDYTTCMHDIALYYDDADLNGLDPEDLQMVQSTDMGKTWKQVSNKDNISRELESNRILVGKWDNPSATFIEGFGRFALASSKTAGIQQLRDDALAPASTYDLMGRKVSAGHTGFSIVNGEKKIRRSTK